MLPKKYEVHWLKIEFDGDSKERPWVVLEDAIPDATRTGKHTVLIAAISSKMDLMNKKEDLELLKKDDPEFEKSSLSSTSHVVRDSVAEVPAEIVDARKRGVLSSEQRRKLDGWMWFWRSQ